jgi:circadian clock protein KaiC
MKMIGIDLQSHLDKGILQIQSTRPSLNGLELHLLNLMKLIKEFKPTTIVIDPISNLITIGTIHEVRSMLVRLIDMLKLNNITVLFTSLSRANENYPPDLAEDSVSSLVDTWITVRDLEGIGERNRGLYIIKSRGMGHSNQVREFVIKPTGIELLEVEYGPEGILTGLARRSNTHNQKVSALKLQHELDRKDREIDRKRRVLEANIEALTKEFESVQEELNLLKASEELKAKFDSEKTDHKRT